MIGWHYFNKIVKYVSKNLSEVNLILLILYSDQAFDISCCAILNAWSYFKKIRGIDLDIILFTITNINAIY